MVSEASGRSSPMRPLERRCLSRYWQNDDRSGEDRATKVDGTTAERLTARGTGPHHHRNRLRTRPPRRRHLKAALGGGATGTRRGRALTDARNVMPGLPVPQRHPLSTALALVEPHCCPTSRRASSLQQQGERPDTMLEFAMSRAHLDRQIRIPHPARQLQLRTKSPTKSANANAGARRAPRPILWLTAMAYIEMNAAGVDVFADHCQAQSVRLEAQNRRPWFESYIPLRHLS